MPFTRYFYPRVPWSTVVLPPYFAASECTQRSAMGIPGSESAVDILLLHPGQLHPEGMYSKVCWSPVLSKWLTWRACLHVVPHTVGPLPQINNYRGWDFFSQSVLSASPHRIAGLSSCLPPESVKGLPFFIGIYKVFSRVVPYSAPTPIQPTLDCDWWFSNWNAVLAQLYE